jgi:hypothetical protein
VSEPLLAIVLRLEAGPRLYVDCADDWEASRLRDWIDSHQELADVRDAALRLQEEWLRRERQP